MLSVFQKMRIMKLIRKIPFARISLLLNRPTLSMVLQLDVRFRELQKTLYATDHESKVERMNRFVHELLWVKCGHGFAGADHTYSRHSGSGKSA